MLQDDQDLSYQVRQIEKIYAKRQPIIDRMVEDLSSYPGDFIFVGASPIRIGLTLMRLDSDRTCHFIPFSGKWMDSVKRKQIDIRQFNYAYNGAPHHQYDQEPLEAYLAHIVPDYTADTLINRSEPLNIVDCTNSGGGLASFADLLLCQAQSHDELQIAARNTRLISLERDQHGWEHLEQYPAKATDYTIFLENKFDKFTEVSGTTLPTESDLWSGLISQKGLHFHENDPRLTEPYPASKWCLPPQLAPASNRAAFARVAQGIDKQRLAEAFRLG